MLSWKELMNLTEDSVDPHPFNTVVRSNMNTGLSDKELVRTIKTRNRQRKPTYLLRLEYQRRLRQSQQHG